MERSFCLHHGTIKEYAESIMSSQKFCFNKREDHWLGNGVYFYVDDFEQAKIWAGLCKKNFLKKLKKTGETPLHENTNEVVFELNYTVDKADYLNLDSITDSMKLDKFIEELKEIGTEINSDNKHKAMCMILDFYVEYYEIKAAKYTFTNKSRNDNLSYLGIEKHGEQFCIYDVDSINFSNVTKKEVV